MNYVIVTGGCGGLGRSSVIELKKRGFNVIAIDKIIKDKIDDVYYIEADLQDASSIDKAYDEVKTILKDDKLKAIVNLAGIFKIETILDGSEEDLRKMIDVNFFGAFRMNRKFIDLLTDGSKIINCTSELAGYSAIPFNSFYGMSKVIYDYYSDCLRRELNYLNVKVIKVRAGSFTTGLVKGVINDYDEMVEKTKYYKSQIKKLKKLMDNEITKVRDPLIFGKLIGKIVSKKHNKLCYNIKRSFKLRFMSALPEKLQDKLYKAFVK